jgi:hypothetical protein
MAYDDTQIRALIAQHLNNLADLTSPGQGENSVPGQLAAAKAFWDRVVALNISADVTAHATARSAAYAAKLAKGWGN